LVYRFGLGVWLEQSVGSLFMRAMEFGSMDG